MKSAVSAVVITHNNSATINSCFKSLTWCSEIIVIDSFSTDDTLKLADSVGAKTYTHHFQNNWSTLRNFGLKQTTNDWVLFVDSDEIVTPKLRREIITELKNPKYNGYLIHRVDTFLKTTLHYGETGNVKLLRLANKKTGHWIRPVHEVWQIKGSVGLLQNPLLHRRNLSLSDFLLRLDLYTSLENFDFHWIDLLKPKVKFFVNYVLHLGFMDGFAGFIMAYFMSLNSLIVRVKSWEKIHT